MRRQSAIAVLAAVLLLLVAFPALVWSGGPPPDAPEPGVKTWRPVLESWRLVSSEPAAPGGGTLCSETMPCDFQEQSAARGRGAVCAWTGTIWLSTSAVPILLRDVTGEVFALALRGDGAVREDGARNVSSHLATFPVSWRNGWWWRAEAERVEVSVPTPCDVRELRLTLNYEGTSWRGRSVSLTQSVEWSAQAS